MARFIFVTGGVLSSLGKGIAASSIAALLQAQGYKVRLRKMDPYINVDPGTMSPYQHGEVFVTDDGAETDLDLGHYERFTGVAAKKTDNTTTGKIYWDVIQRERRGDYLGATVQVIPHITDRIKEYILYDTEDLDFLICEVGGTVGDIEGLPYIEAIRQLGNEVGRHNMLYIHLTLIPYIPTAGELKTKPTQHSVKELLSFGIQPDILLCRSERPLGDEERMKLALFCNLPKKRVLSALDVETIYQVPVSLQAQGLDREICLYFNLKPKSSTKAMAKWRDFVHRLTNPKHHVTIAIVGKYTSTKDAYKSISEAIVHAGVVNKTRVNIRWVESDTLNPQNLKETFQGVQGILVPGGFGSRGVEGKILAIRYAREHKISYLGICFGMQLAIIEIARHLANLPKANSTELGRTITPIVGLMSEWIKEGTVERRTLETNKGGTMRLGLYPCELKRGSLAFKAYGKSEIEERHRHRYEVNLKYREDLEKAGVVFSGISPDGLLPEIIELKGHPWFVGVQFHPELKSKPFDPHPLFVAFIKAVLKNS